MATSTQMNASDKTHAKQGDHHQGAHSPVFYVRIWMILVILLIVSVLGSETGIQSVTLVSAFGIAFVKAYLVAKNFMHLNIERRYVVYLLLTAVALMLVFFFGTAPDVMKHDGQLWNNTAAKAEVSRAQHVSTHGHGTEPKVEASARQLPKKKRAASSPQRSAPRRVPRPAVQPPQKRSPH